jgi:diguanylate cyclase (GGDEF)-like protein
MLGHEPGDLADTSIERLFVSRSAFEATVTQANQAFAKRENFRCQIQMKRKDAGLIWVDLSGVQLADGFTFWTLADITAMRQAHERIEHLAFHDELTGLANRLLLNDRLQQAIALVRRDGGNLAVCYLDLDGFKPINDEHGHDAGDTLLREIASRLGKTVRAIDTVARVGGDEFVVLLLLDELTEDWETAAQRLMEAVARPVTLPNGTAVHVGMSVGVALCPKDGTDGATLVDRADRALLLSKRTGKGRIRAYSPALAAGSQ